MKIGNGFPEKTNLLLLFMEFFKEFTPLQCKVKIENLRSFLI
jgi:hypothetical protein